MKKKVPEKNVSKLLNPSPVVLVTALAGKRPQVCSVAWCMPVDFIPPKAIVILAAGQATSEAVAKSGELVLNIPGEEMAAKVLACGRTSGLERDKFRDFALKIKKSRKVAAPSLAECLASCECRVIERNTAFGRKLRKGFDAFFVEIIHAVAEEKFFRGRWLTEKGVKFLHHLGGDSFALTGGLLTPKRIY